MLARLASSRSCLLPRIIVSSRFNSKAVFQRSHESNHSVDSDCIPLTGSYSINDLLASSFETSLLPEETLHKLHKLSGLPYPSCSADEVAELVKVVRGIRSEKVRELLEQANEDFGNIEPGWGKRIILFDGKKEGKEKEEYKKETEDDTVHGIELMKDSHRTSGDFYTVGRRRL